ncbi:hypothetical protein V6N13_148605 [Hibiscus sabdariffa]
MFDLAINTTLDQNPSRPTSSLRLEICVDFSCYGNKAVRYFWPFGKEFSNLFALKFLVSVFSPVNRKSKVFVPKLDDLIEEHNDSTCS